MDSPFISSSFLFLLLFLLFCTVIQEIRCIDTNSNQTTFQIHYASWFTRYSSSHDFQENTYNFTTFNWTKLLIPTRTDDNPYESVPFPFPFPLFGLNQFITYVGANGNLLFDTAYIPPCGGFCGPVSQYYYGSINGILTDFNPSQSKQSFIGYVSTNSYIIFKFFKLEFYGFTLSKNTFYIKLSKDGGIRIYYDTITLPSDLPELYGKTNPYYPNYILSPQSGFLSGIRQFASYPPYYSMTSGQFTDMISWNQTTINGIYPNLQLLQSHALWTACPISDLWCMSPSYFNLSSIENTNITFSASLSTITPISCTDSFISYQCTFLFQDSTGDPEQIRIYSPAIMDNQTSSVFTCELSPSILLSIYHLFSTFLSSSELITFVGIRGKLSAESYLPGNVTATSFYVDILSPSIKFSFINLNQNESAVAGIGSCAVTSAVTEVNITKPCNTCDICQQSFSCLYGESSCPLQENIYSRPNCASNCTFPESLPNLNGLYNYDFNGDCCVGTNIDCSGICGGRRKPGLTSVDGTLDNNNILFTEYDCCKVVDCAEICNGNTKVDCAGVCGGTATYDDCGVCSGGTTGIIPDQDSRCTPILVITPYSSSNPIYTNITYEKPVTTLNSQQTFVLTVTNPSKYNASVIISVSDDDSSFTKDPLVTTAPTIGHETILTTNSTVNIIITVSLKRLLMGNITSWEVKTLTITTQRPGLQATIRTSSIAIYPSVLGCEAISSQSVCSSAPMCSFCFTTDSYRILRESSDINIRERRLFDRIVPTTTNPNNRPLSGYCVSGISESVCTDYPSLISTDVNRYFWWIIVFCIPMTILLFVFLFSVLYKL